ncbi:DUF4157 domain-containing protein [Sphingomonas sp.]|uniref:eCIS core domain-containing protein n=1 Tax=Sphingomonas sp. TaxID=28214 RepID=UPI0028AEDCFD|nr:DUF4157 domain-containing protein [Sphingomonas sp.]
MSGGVIQARYLGGQPGPQLAQMRPVGAPTLAGAVQAKAPPGLAGPPPLAGQALQARGAPMPPSRALQAHGAAESFAVDPVRLGLGQGRGRPLPDAVRAKMEAAFGTDFSRVRVHEGPQAARIGAIAFTTGHDIYFAPGQYRPETVQGQQLLGHELAHVVQQRQGRVKAPGSGVSVVQDYALEAEADRLGMRAAVFQATSLYKMAPGNGSAQQRMKINASSRSLQRAQLPVVFGYDDATANITENIVKIFAQEYKGADVPFSGSTVYSVGWSEGSDVLWSSINSATGYIGKSKASDVVKYWDDNEQNQPYSNTVRRLKNVNLSRPAVLSSNAHAEANQILRHAVFALENKHSPHDLGLIISSDVQHCAECWWAYNALMRHYKIKTIYNVTGTSRRLFERWREPWDGFYKSYGDNPFRASNGALVNGLVHGTTYAPYQLNALTQGGVGNIY